MKHYAHHSQRQLMVAKSITKCVADAFVRERFHTKSLDLRKLRVIEASVSKDLRYCRILVANAIDSQSISKDQLAELHEITRDVGTMICKDLRLKYFPTVTFEFSSSSRKASCFDSANTHHIVDETAENTPDSI